MLINERTHKTKTDIKTMSLPAYSLRNEFEKTETGNAGSLDLLPEKLHKEFEPIYHMLADCQCAAMEIY